MLLSVEAKSDTENWLREWSEITGRDAKRGTAHGGESRGLQMDWLMACDMTKCIITMVSLSQYRSPQQ